MVSWLSSFAATSALGRLTEADRLRAAETIHAGAVRIGAGLSGRQLAVVTSLADTILPPSDTPGAVDVGVPQFIDHLVADWYDATERTELLGGIDAIDALAKRRLGKGLVEATSQERNAIAADLDGKKDVAESPAATFAKIKGLTVYGYFTSKRVQTEILKNPVIPGRFDGCIPAGGR